MTEKLLPCPFCGGTPILELFNDGFFDYARIRCCLVMFDWCGDETGEQAITAWNRRAEPENKPLTLDELRKMDGEPVWMARAKKWVFISTVVTEPYAQVWYFFKGFVYTVLYHHEEFYRNKPERSEV